MKQDKNHNFIPDDLSNYKVVRKGDLVINKMKAWQGSLGLAPCDGIVSPAYYVFQFELGDLTFGHALLRSRPYVSAFGRVSDGVRIGQWDLSISGMKRIPVVVPPTSDQAHIVCFLAHAERRIGRYVRAKQRLIKLLEEQKQAIIHRAVTRGLDPAASIKSTDNAWFPSVPEGWSVLPMRRVIRSAVDGPHHSPSYLDDGIPFLSARNVRADRWSLSDAKYISEDDYEEFSRRVRPEPGDVLYTKGGTTGVARAVDLTFRFQVWVHIAVLKLDRTKISPEFLALALNSPRCYEQSQLFTRGATNQDLGLGRMKDIVLPVPPLPIQSSIVKSVTSAISEMNGAIQAATREIVLLREYRTRLIADIVTGKLDVREAAARLPDERDEPPDEIAEEALDAETGEDLAETEEEAT